MEVWNSALRLNFIDAGITRLKSFNSDTLKISKRTETQGLRRSTLILNEGAYSHLINGSFVLVSACPVAIRDVSAIRSILATES